MKPVLLDQELYQIIYELYKKHGYWKVAITLPAAFLLAYYDILFKPGNYDRWKREKGYV